ncbi:MAG: hypothetical protein ABWY25_07085 [Paenisporosarcina sp.]
MSLLIPNTAQLFMLNALVDRDMKLKLFSNNLTPAVTDTVASLTEVAGGGYTAITLDDDDWVVTIGPPAVAVFNAFQDFNFTGATSGPGTIYGYYITDSGGTQLLWEERFPTVPFVPLLGSLIRVKPRITLNNAD